MCSSHLVEQEQSLPKENAQKDSLYSNTAMQTTWITSATIYMSESQCICNGLHTFLLLTVRRGREAEIQQSRATLIWMEKQC